MPSNNQLLSDSAFFALRFLLSVILLCTIFLTIRRAIHHFVGPDYKQLGRKKYVMAGLSVIVLSVSLTLREEIGNLLQILGANFGRAVPVITQEWMAGVLVALFDTIVALTFLLLSIQTVGAVYWFFESRLAARSAKKQHVIGSPAASLYILKAFSFINRLCRTTILVVLIAAFLIEIFYFFRGSKPIVDTFMQSLGTPAGTVAKAVLSYLPNLGYLVMIGILGWGLIRLVKFTFHSLDDGTLHIPGFSAEWSGPTYKLLRFVILLFLLMVSLPYLPGAGSQFFQGFSVFVGALVTFGSTGAISNIVSGITLTYTNAFRVGDLVRIGETVGFVREKSLLVTRVVTLQNESVTIPNGNILSTSILNYTFLAASAGLVLTVDAGIGYDVDWRTVERLMIEGARKTRHVLTNPSPCVWQTQLGDYAVSYQLRAWTDRADQLYETNSALRANVLDEFNRAGVEIMTPSIFAHRDASGLAIPPEQYVDAAAARVIAVNVHQSHSGSAASANKAG